MQPPTAQCSLPGCTQAPVIQWARRATTAEQDTAATLTLQQLADQTVMRRNQARAHLNQLNALRIAHIEDGQDIHLPRVDRLIAKAQAELDAIPPAPTALPPTLPAVVAVRACHDHCGQLLD